VVQSQKIPTTWPEFENALRTEFVPQDSLRRSRDKIRKLTQRNSVSAYLAEFRNVSLMIPNMTEDEKVDRFCVGLKPQIRLEVLKSGVQTLEQAARIALNVDSALYGAEMFSEGGQSRGNTSAEVPQPMDIGNLEQGTRRVGSVIRTLRTTPVSSVTRLAVARGSIGEAQRVVVVAGSL